VGCPVCVTVSLMALSLSVCHVIFVCLPNVFHNCIFPYPMIVNHLPSFSLQNDNKHHRDIDLLISLHCLPDICLLYRRAYTVGMSLPAPLWESVCVCFFNPFSRRLHGGCSDYYNHHLRLAKKRKKKDRYSQSRLIAAPLNWGSRFIGATEQGRIKRIQLYTKCTA
jgi:hypothetical protein